MKFRVKIFSALFFVFMLVSCQDGVIKTNDTKPNVLKPALTDDEINRLVLLDSSYLVAEQDARKYALQLANQFLTATDGKQRSIESVLKVPSLYSLKNVTSIKTPKEISKPETPSLYIYNFTGKNGFVILAADKRAVEVIATVAAGRIDSLSHPGFQVFLSNTIHYIDSQVAAKESLRNDEIFKSLLTKLNAAPYYAKEQNKGGRVAWEEGSCELRTVATLTQSVNVTSYVSTPLLNTLWSQESPYNNGMPDAGCYTVGTCATNAKYLAGCVPVSEGQVVAFFKAKVNSNWESIVSNVTCSTFSPGNASDVSTLLHDIFLEYGIYVDRECGSTKAGWFAGDMSFTDPRGISPGYGLVEGEWRGWNTTDIRNSLYQGSPVIIRGTTDLCCFIYCWGCDKGHQWVIDGMRDLNVVNTYRIIEYYVGTGCNATQRNYYAEYDYVTSSTSGTQIHQNWGWGPSQGSGPNDWYAQNVFQSTSSANSYHHANYIVAYITPN